MSMDAATDGYLHGMPFMNRLLESTTAHRGHKRRRTHRLTRSDTQMSLFATRHLAPPLGSGRKMSTDRHVQQRDDIDEYLSSDLELSFASNVSLNSPPRRNHQLPDSDAMDISPMPPPRRAVLDGLGAKSSSRPRALTSNSRLFGSDISNGTTAVAPQEVKPTGTTGASKRLARSALPAEWMSSMRPQEPAKPEPPTQPSSPIDDAMDVDTSYHVDPQPILQPVNFSPVPQSAAPTMDGFNNLFFDTASPRRSFEPPSHMPKKRRSLSPESNRAISKDVDSSPMHPSSPSDSKLDRLSNAAGRNNKPTLQGLGAPSASFIKRQRRPVLSEVVQPSDFSIHSAHPEMSPGLSSRDHSSPSGPSLPPVRRAFSALLPPSIYTQAESEGDSSFDGADMSSPAQAYAHRKTIRRCDGTEDFRPLTGATAMTMNESPSQRFMAPGMPGFGDNEAHGKLLPCHRVTEDGLMRITAQTVDQLLDGKYDNKINDFHIIDCRFDYEYAGGHIRGAVNINTTSAVEELLLGPSLTKPRPSVSGDTARKTILIFHCEFSAKRAPTFAKHLRAKDRAMNNHVYPKIHYPEVYILEGGYCHYYKSSGRCCEPKAYVTMDDPNHAMSRQQDLDQFRKAKFGRHKSYAYGDGPMKTAAAQQVPPKRNTAPTSLFAAANAARTRRAGSVSLMTLAEDGNTTAEAEHEDTDTDLGDSPCPPPTKTAALKVKKPFPRHLVRSETYNPSRMPLNFD